MDGTRGITVKVAVELHGQVKAEQESLGVTMNQYITMILEQHFNGKGRKSMEGARTLAFQVDEELFRRIKAHIARNPKLTQRSFVIGLIEQALNEAEAALEAAARSEPEASAEQTGGMEGGGLHGPEADADSANCEAAI